MRPETMWFITGTFDGKERYVYGGSGYPIRRDAITMHCAAVDKNWPACKARGDRAVKCRIVPVKWDAK